MWAVLKSDLKEFASGLTEETTTVLEAIDKKIEDVEEAGQVERDDDGDSGNDSGNDRDEDSQSAAYGYDSEFGLVMDGRSGYEATGIVSSPADEVARLRSLEETYTTPLLPGEGTAGERGYAPEAGTGATDDDEEAAASEVAGATDDEEGGASEVAGATDEEEGASEDGRVEEEAGEDLDPAELERISAFLGSFDLETKTDDVCAVLEAYPNTVKVHFETLVPTVVKYEHFWKRYYYRCDERRVKQTWDDESERARVARQVAISGGIAGVKMLFGGAVKALGSVGMAKQPPSSGSGTYKKYQTEMEQQRMTGVTGVGGLGASLFGTGNRPPFVMNTVVSDDDIKNENVEEEEEEELGWSDDDDDDDEDEYDDESGDADGSRGLEQISVSEQIDFTSASDKNILVDLRNEVVQLEGEGDQLKQTVEMQAKEIAELRRGVQSQETTDAGSESSFSDELEELKMKLFEKDSELAALRASIDDNDEQENDVTAERSANDINLEHELKLTKNELTKTKEEVSVLRVQLDEGKKDLETVQQTANNLASKLDAAEAKISKSTARAETLQADLLCSQQDIKEMRSNPQASTNPTLQIDEEEDSTPSSDLSGIKVEHSLIPPKEPTADEKEEDDWGDSWSEGDE